ncbi:MAG: hypothetical protein IPN47_12825 [Gemmatimonadetes bacterium]|nr:hypothetical protein [Gemmatimonadota bacterium]
MRGFQVVVENSRPDIRTGDVLQRLDDALQLIEQAQPWRLRHLRSATCALLGRALRLSRGLLPR